MPSLECWQALAGRIYAKGVDVFDGCSITPSEDGPRDPKVIALTLYDDGRGHECPVLVAATVRHH
jgi:hypothetical protein